MRKIIRYSTDRENGVFTLDYEQDREYNSPTEIYVHKAYKSIECTAEYTVEPIEGTEASRVYINGNPGTHKLVIKF